MTAEYEFTDRDEGGTICDRDECEHTLASHVSYGSCEWCKCQRFLHPDHDDEPESRRTVKRVAYLREVADREVLDAAIVAAYRWVNPPWGDPPVPALVEDFRGDLVESLHRHGLVITTRSRFDELKSKEMVYEPVVKNLVGEFNRLFPAWVAAIARVTHSPVPASWAQDWNAPGMEAYDEPDLGDPELVVVRYGTGGVRPDGTTNHPPIDYSAPPVSTEATS